MKTNKIQFSLNYISDKQTDFINFLEYVKNKCNLNTEIQVYKSEHDYEINYFLSFDKVTEAKVFIFKFFDAIDVPDHDFGNITKNDFSILAYDQDIINLISYKLQESSNKDISMLDSICSDLAQNLMETEKKVGALENYVIKSGLIHYEQFMTEFIYLLGKNGIIDPDTIKTKMFNTIH